MIRNVFGRIGWEVSGIGFGAWAIGADWGNVPEDQAMAALHAAVDAGVNLIDTADVYGDGRSEQLVGRLLRERRGDVIHVATKAGRRLQPHTADGYNARNLEAFVDRSLTKLGVEAVELLQLHCPPTDVYYRPEVFDALDDLVRRGKLLHYGVSVEKVEEALKAIEYPGVESVQIILNMFRMRPLERFVPRAHDEGVAVLARVPLASGLLTGKMRADTEFTPDDHRTYNRRGEAFDVGETFSGVPFEVGLAAVEELRPLVPDSWTMAQFSLRWLLMHEGVTVAIPGAKNPEQAAANAAAGDLPTLDDATMAAARDVYDRLIAPHVHQRW